MGGEGSQLETLAKDKKGDCPIIRSYVCQEEPRQRTGAEMPEVWSSETHV